MRTPLLILAGLVAACGGSGDSQADSADMATFLIGEVQGQGRASPLVEQEVIVEGVVTGDFQEGDDDQSRNLGGFYIQGSDDGDPATSDGVFVFDGNQPSTNVNPGDLVWVAGTVAEHYGETQVVASDIAVLGTGNVEPTPVSLPVSTIRNSDGDLIADLEAFEGMLVTFPQSLTVSQLRNLERFGEVLLSEGGRQYSFTNSNSPDVQGYADHLEAINSRRIHLDDGLRTNGSGSLLPVRNGDEISNLTGVLRYSRGSGASGTEAYRLMPTEALQLTTVNPRPGPPETSGTIRIATFNSNNFFSTIDTGANICGPAQDMNCRGANSAEELSRQLEKIVTALSMMDAHVLAMVELENNDAESLRLLANALNASAGPDQYAFIETGTIGDDAIKVGLIYRPASVSPVGDFAVLDSSVDPRFDDSRHRPVLAQSFDTVGGNYRFTVAVNHLKSKGSSCDSLGDPDLRDGQANCSATRSLGAAAMVDWLASDPTDAGDSDIIVIGDFNTHTMGDAMAQFETAGYVNLASRFIGPDTYSFEFDGQFGSLDHAMANPGFAQKVVDVTEWRINADESRMHDYNLEFDRDPGIFNGSSPYRATDHDPLIIGIEY